MRRRERITVMGSAAAAWPLATRAQQGERMRRVGVLMPFRNDDPDGQGEIAALRQGLAERGWIEARTIGVAVRWAGSDPIEVSAREFVGARPDLLISRTTPTTATLKNERVIPLVFVNVAGPAEHGLVQSLSQPGRNITGFQLIYGTHGVGPC